MTSIRALIAKLDVAPQGSAASGNIWVVHLKNADATKLATVLRAAFSAAGGAGGRRRRPARRQRATGRRRPRRSAHPGRHRGHRHATSAAAQPITPSAGPSTGGFIQADPATNSLIITAPEPLYRQVRMMIDQLDERRAQVYIESLIVEVTGDNAADFGFQWQGIIASSSDNNALVGGTNFGTAGNLLDHHRGATRPDRHGTGTPARRHGARAGLLGQGLNIGLVHNFFGTFALAAIAKLLQSQANTNIASTPNLVTLDNEEAKIVVGSNVPFVTGQFTQHRRRDDEPVPDDRAQGRRHHAAHPAADRRERHDPHDDLPGGVEPVGAGRARHVERGPVDQQALDRVERRRRRRPDHRPRRPDRGPLHRQQVEGAAARRHSLPRRAVPQREPHQEANESDGLPAPGRHARRRDHEQALARPLRPDPRLPAGDAADAERAPADQRIAGDRTDPARRGLRPALGAADLARDDQAAAGAAGRPARRPSRWSCR